MNPDLIVRPEIVAGKLAAAANLSQPELADALDDDPRLVEALWFLQWISMQPGGFKEWTPGFIKESADCIGPSALVNAPGPLTEKVALEIWRAFPCCYWEGILPGDAWKNRARRQERENGTGEWEGLSALFRSHDRVYSDEEGRLSSALAKLDRPAFVSAALRAAELTLPAYLASLCNESAGGYARSDKREPLTNPPWYFANIVTALFAAMDSHARRVSAGIAQTEIALKVNDALEYALSEKALVQITGDARFGKTECLRAYCDAHPGKARLVTAPSSNLDADLWRAIADALGIAHDYKTPPRKLKETVEFTVRHAGLMFIFDESHFLLPARYSPTTAPARLNWLRTNLVDRQVPVVLVSTPQAYDHAVAKYVKASGYNIEQWTGRIMLRVTLPGELDFEDLLAIAKIKCPEMDSDLRELIVAKAQQSENFIMAVEAIAKRARYLARRDGHAEITLADVDLATAEFIPGTLAPIPAKITAAKRQTRPAPRCHAVLSAKALATAEASVNARHGRPAVTESTLIPA
jgi:hypothetical protein